MAATHPNAGIAANSDVRTRVPFRAQSYKEICETYDSLLKVNTHVTDDGWYYWHELGSNVWMSEIGHRGWPLSFISIKLYDTEIVRYYPDDTFTVSNGGFNTLTTRQRIAQFTPKGWNAWHENKKLYLVGHGKKIQTSVHNIHNKVAING